MDMTVFAERLKIARKQRGMFAREVAKSAGVSEKTIIRYENATGKRVNAATLMALAECLNVSVDYLTGASDSKQAVQEAQKTGISDEEKLLLELFKQVPPESRQTFLEKLAVDVVRYSLKRNQS